SSRSWRAVTASEPPDERSREEARPPDQRDSPCGNPMTARAKAPGPRRLAVGPALGLAALLAGCSTAAGRIEGGTFYSPKGYTVRLPENGWGVEPRRAAP